jgi:hypothetical protein
VLKLTTGLSGPRSGAAQASAHSHCATVAQPRSDPADPSGSYWLAHAWKAGSRASGIAKVAQKSIWSHQRKFEGDGFVEFRDVQNGEATNAWIADTNE